jgi:hypothetical protein
MNEIIEQYKKTKSLHHFYILVGEKNSVIENILEFCKSNLVPKDKINSSIFQYNFDHLLIDDARAIVERSNLKAEKGSKTIFIISFNQVTREAQNSFLKCIEEPTKDTIFFFIVSDSNLFLPTVLSRAVIVKEDNHKSADILNELMRKNIGQRMKFVDSVVKDIKDEKKPKIFAREIVESLITELEKGISKKPEYSKSLKDLQKIYSYLCDQSASIKILLEKAVLSLPK